MRGVCMSQAPGGWELTSDDSRVQLSELDYLGKITSTLWECGYCRQYGARLPRQKQRIEQIHNSLPTY